MKSGTVVSFYEPGNSQSHDGYAPNGWLLGERWATGMRQERWYEALDLAQADLCCLGMEVSEDGMRAKIPDAPGCPGSDATIHWWDGGPILLGENGMIDPASSYRAGRRAAIQCLQGELDRVFGTVERVLMIPQESPSHLWVELDGVADVPARVMVDATLQVLALFRDSAGNGDGRNIVVEALKPPMEVAERLTSLTPGDTGGLVEIHPSE